MTSTLDAPARDSVPGEPTSRAMAAGTGSSSRRPLSPRTLERILVLALLIGTGALYLIGLDRSGWGNAFYAAAVQSGTKDWTAFIYASSDWSNSITVDKPPLSIWVMALSARVFGLSSWSILVPQALMGVATVGVLYGTVRRRFGMGTSLLAAAILALTPVAALMFRYDNPDALLLLLLVGAIAATLRAVEDGRVRWLILAGGLVGLGFLTKQLQAFLVLPALAGVYLWAGPRTFRRRVLESLSAIGGLLVTSVWWVAIVELTPSGSRPYIGGSTTDSFLELTFGYNGLGRITGQEGGGLAETGSSPTGLARLFDLDTGTQISWLLPLALICIPLVFVLMRREPRVSPQRATFAMFAIHLVVTAAAFSFMAGIFHAYYTVALAPSIAVLVAVGLTYAWRMRDERVARLLIAGALVQAGFWAWSIFGNEDRNWMPWMSMVILALAALAVVGVLASDRVGRRGRVGVAIIVLASLLIAPSTYALQAAINPHNGAIVRAEPARDFIRLPAAQLTGTTALGLLDAPVVGSDAVEVLRATPDAVDWTAAAVGSNRAAGYQLASDRPVMALGGFNGSDPSPTLERFQQLVADGRIGWFIDGELPDFETKATEAERILNWVHAEFEPEQVDGVDFYRLTD